MTPSLYGVTQSNRNFLLAANWGKNIFNSAFPASLMCYMHSLEMEANYLQVTDDEIEVVRKSFDELLRISPNSKDVFFAFESQFSPFQQYIVGNLPRADLVIRDLSGPGRDLCALEAKLTALPDDATHNLSPIEYGCELVIRPDQIVYLAASLANGNPSVRTEAARLNGITVKDWTNLAEVSTHINEISSELSRILLIHAKEQSSFLLQAIWKTEGKSAVLADDCLDIFIWSDLAFAKFILQRASSRTLGNGIGRPTRTMVWLYKMLHEIGLTGKTNADQIIDSMSFDTRNDKAFSVTGRVTSPVMRCQSLLKPRIGRNSIDQIILGGGQILLSPERRFDAVVNNTPDLFSTT